jgi:DNA-binding NtrC family response regulator
VVSDETRTQLFLPQVSLPASLAERELFLDVVEGPDRGKTFGPLVAPLRIGSARGNDIVLDDATVSRFHCTLERGEHGPLIADAGSTNGTLLGTFRIKEAFLSEGAVVRLGQSALVVRLSANVRRVELSTRTVFGSMIGESPAMRALFATLAKLAPADVPVLVEGPTGTGKELVARALHAESPRQGNPFVIVDCGAVAPTLIESELFGHEKGAFTGADNARPGAFELADRGTLFLDEIGELPLSLQPKLLRVLEAGTVKRLGASAEKQVFARVVAATHRNLRKMVNEGTFREDLYFRLAVLPVSIPPLADRPDDIVPLARHFLARALRAAAPDPRLVPEGGPPLSPETAAILRAEAWPGNVRELRNVIERAVIMGDLQEVSRGELAPLVRRPAAGGSRDGEASSSAPVPIEEAKRRFEREYLIKLLARHGDDIGAAAAEADLHPKSLQRLIRRHNLRE